MNRFQHWTGASLFLWLASLCAAWAQGLPSIQPAEAGLSAERLARIDKAIERHITQKELSGAVTLIARYGKVAHLGVYGMADVEAGKPMRKDSMFRIASMTKPVTSVAVMMLYEEGRFLLGDPVSKYIPAFDEMKVLPPKGSEGVEPAEAKGKITIRQLLTHTSGLSYQWNPRLGRAYKNAGVTHGLLQDDKTIREGVDKLATVPLLFHPGERYEYGLSIDVLGRLVEVVSGRPLDAFLEERIFKPLRMVDTHFFPPKEKLERLAAVYRRKEGEPIRPFGGKPIIEDAFVYSADYPHNGPQQYFSGGGGLVSTISDYARFCQMMLNGGELDGTRLLSPKTVELMTVNQVGDLNPDSGFGLGFSVVRDHDDQNELGSVGTFGWGGFWNTTFFIDPAEEFFGILMSQIHPNGGLPLTGTFRNLAFQSIVEKADAR